MQGVSIYVATKTALSYLPFFTDPEREQHEQARIKALANLRRLGSNQDDSNSEDETDDRTTRRPRVEDLALDQYESQIAMEVVAPEDIPVGFEGMAAMPNKQHLG